MDGGGGGSGGHSGHRYDYERLVLVDFEQLRQATYLSFSSSSNLFLSASSAAAFSSFTFSSDSSPPPHAWLSHPCHAAALALTWDGMGRCCRLAETHEGVSIAGELSSHSCSTAGLHDDVSAPCRARLFWGANRLYDRLYECRS